MWVEPLAATNNYNKICEWEFVCQFWQRKMGLWSWLYATTAQAKSQAKASEVINVIKIDWLIQLSH